MEPIKLTKPITVDGKEITEITPDFDSLSVLDLDSVLKYMSKPPFGRQPAFPLENDLIYTAGICVLAAGLDLSVLLDCGAKNVELFSLTTRNLFFQG